MWPYCDIGSFCYEKDIQYHTHFNLFIKKIEHKKDNIKVVQIINNINFMINHPNIQGLYLYENLINSTEESNLLKTINHNVWSTELSRRVQHYGYKYDYKKRKVNIDDYLGELPEEFDYLGQKIVKSINDSNIYETSLNVKYFDQLIINEYKKNQGISPHIDCVPCFDDCICSVTLGNEADMTFAKDDVSYDVKLKRKSLVVLTGDARHNWTHGIYSNKNKNFSEMQPRVSLTYRHVKQ